MPTFKERIPLQTVFDIKTGTYQMFKLMEACLLFKDNPNNLMDIPTHEKIETLLLFQKMSQQNLGNIDAAFIEEKSSAYYPNFWGKKVQRRTLAFPHQTKHSVARIVITSITAIALGSFLYLKTIAKADDLNLYEQLREYLNHFSTQNSTSFNRLLYLLTPNHDKDLSVKNNFDYLGTLFQEAHLLKIDLFFFEHLQPTDPIYPAKEIHQKTKEHCNSLDPHIDIAILFEKLKKITLNDKESDDTYLQHIDNLLNLCTPIPSSQARLQL